MTHPKKKPASRKPAARKVPKKVQADTPPTVAKSVEPAPPAPSSAHKLVARLSLSKKQWGAIAAALSVLAGAISMLAGSSPAPTAAPTPAATVSTLAARTARPAATPTPPAPRLAGTSEVDLNQPGDTQPSQFRPFTAPAPLPGCVSRFNTANFSSRNGVAVRELVAHYTVSRNVPGWADVNANADFLNRASTQASASAIIDAEGHCLYTVPVGLKSWTEANANPFSFGVEFVDMGDEGKLSPAALKQGGRVFAAIARLEHIPVQLGHVVNCQPVVAGEVDHGSLGQCGGGHHDLRPFYGSSIVPRASDDAKVMAALIAATKAAMPKPTPTGLAALTSAERSAAAQLTQQRRIARRHGGWDKIDPMHRGHAIAAKQLLAKADATVRVWVAKDGWTARRRARDAELRLLIRG